MIRFTFRAFVLALVALAFLPFPGRAGGWDDIFPQAVARAVADVTPTDRPSGAACCSPACTCGCQQGGDCVCGAVATTPAAPAAYYPPPQFYAPAFRPAFFGGGMRFGGGACRGGG